MKKKSYTVIEVTEDGKTNLSTKKELVDPSINTDDEFIKVIIRFSKKELNVSKDQFLETLNTKLEIFKQIIIKQQKKILKRTEQEI